MALARKSSPSLTRSLYQQEQQQQSIRGVIFLSDDASPNGRENDSDSQRISIKEETTSATNNKRRKMQ